MKIREEIKLVNIALSNTLDLYRLWAKKNQINYHALLILYTLNDYEICTQKQICEWWALPKQTVHGLLVDLEKKGYITITVKKDNKREKLIAFTDSGRNYASSILDRLLVMEENAMLQLGAEKRKQLIETNTKYYEILKEAIQYE